MSPNVPEIAYSVRKLNGDIEQAYSRLQPEMAETLKAGVLSWRFHDCPAGPGLYAVATTDLAQKHVVGMIGFAPARVKLNGQLHLVYQAIDTVVDPECRGRGVFVELGNAFYKDSNAPAVFGFPNENAAPGWYRRLGWKQLGTVPFLLKPMRSGYLMRRLHLPFANRLDVPLRSPLRHSHTDGVSVIEKFDSSADALWEEFSRDVGCAVDRKSDYLNWRLVDNPDAQYRILGMKDASGQLMAFVASRVFLDKHGGRAGYIMEAMSLPGARADLHRVMRATIQEMHDQKVDFVLAWAGSHAPNYSTYRKTGFIPLLDRLRPIQIYFGARTLAEGLSGFDTSRKNWYLSYLDSDTV